MTLAIAGGPLWEGMAWAMIFGLPNFFYFSFVTLSTLGSGDISPVSAPAQMLSAFEAVLGQVYLAFLFAMLLGMFLTQRTGGSQGRDGE